MSRISAGNCVKFAGFGLCLTAIVASWGCKKRADAAASPSESIAHAAGDGHEGHDEHADEVTLDAAAIERNGIKVEAAQLWSIKPTFVTPARVSFNTEAMAHVGSPLKGRAAEILVRVGDSVKKGDPLLIIESPELGEAQADLLQKRVAAESTGPAVDLAKASWERLKGLYDQTQGISLTEVQKREAEYKGAVAAQRAAVAAATAAENRLHLLGMSQAAIEAFVKTGEVVPRYTIHAAIDGQVIQREITLGELVGPERESVMVLADTRTLWILADVPEARLAEVAVGAKAWVSTGIVNAKKFEGKVAFVAPQVDGTTRTAQVRIEVPAAVLTLKPGMFAQVEIVASAEGGEDPPRVVAVPDEAVQTVEGGPAVFVPVPNEPGTFAKRAVTVGKVVGGLVPILSGLAEGEQFVSAGSFILKADLGKSGAAHEH